MQCQGWFGRAKVLCNCQCRGALLILIILEHEPAVLAAGEGWASLDF